MKTPYELTEYFLTRNMKWITSGDDTQYCFLEEDGENILFFAPSNSLEDWKNNFCFWKKPYKQMKTKFYVHSGFLKCWKLIEDEILDYIKGSKMTNLTIVGWSYGGALATICTEDIWFTFPKLKTRTITFGSPKAFSKIGFKNIKERFTNMFMFKNGPDIITTLPFSFLGYNHVDSLINIGDKPILLGYFRPDLYHAMKSKKNTGYNITLKNISKGI